MKNEAFNNLVEGYRHFRNNYLSEQYVAYRLWATKSQKPRIMMIACSDSRVNPVILTHAGLGDVFMVNNVANLIPPYKEGKDTHHSTSSALEFALTELEVEEIIILGHSECGGIKALMNDTKKTAPGAYSFIAPWVQIAAKAKEKVRSKYPECSHAEQTVHCEKAALLVSLENLETFPWVKSALENGKHRTHAWYFDIGSGDIFEYNVDQDCFFPLLDME